MAKKFISLLAATAAIRGAEQLRAWSAGASSVLIVERCEKGSGPEHGDGMRRC